MQMPGRLYKGGGYRFGYQKQEKDDEISGQGNMTTAKFWEYDTRLGRRWNLDPKYRALLSSYSTFADNPLLNIDINGDTWDGANNEQTKKDVNSLVRTDNQKYIKYTDLGNGKMNIKLDFGNLAQDKVDDILDKDAGLSLIQDHVDSKRKYFYEASEVFHSNGDVFGNRQAESLDNREHGVVNASNFGRDSQWGNNDKPMSGYDGQVAIQPSAIFYEYDDKGTEIVKSRGAIVFHELSENFERTQHDKDYYGQGIFGVGAHGLAQMRERLWWNESEHHGEVTKVVRPTRTEEKRNADKQLKIFWIRDGIIK